jgi:hypothetical protein
MAIDVEKKNIYLPLSHNYAMKFSYGIRKYFNSSIDIYSPNPDKINCKISDRVNMYKVSHDCIDSVTSIINLINNANSKTIYSSHCLKDVTDYLALQDEDEDFYLSPRSPELV